MKYTRLCAVIVAIALLSTGVSALEYPDIDAGAALLYDMGSGETLFSQNASQKAYPASLTKIMTAILCIERGELDDVAIVTNTAIAGLAEAGSAVNLKVGEELTVRDLIHLLLIASGNDAANVLAEHLSGSVENFVKSMNERAAALGCSGTLFMNPHGLHNDNHYSTADDLLKITVEALKLPLFREIVSMSKYEIPKTNKTATKRTILSTNHLISNLKDPNYLYPDAKGVKTGFTTPAGYCLIAYAEKSGFNLISVVLGASKDSKTNRLGNFNETIRLLNWGADSFTYKTLITSTEAISEVPVRLANDKDFVVLSPAGSIEHLVPVDLDVARIEKTAVVNEDISAPIKKGQRLGTVTVSYEGRTFGTLDLIATNDVERSDVLYYIDRMESVLKSKAFRVVIFCIVLFVIFLVIYIIFANRARRRKRRQYRRASDRQRKPPRRR